jgi:hypothetical protein
LIEPAIEGDAGWLSPARPRCALSRGHACAAERAADPLDRPQIDAKPRRDLVGDFGRSSLYSAGLIRFRASHIAEVDQAAFPRPWLSPQYTCCVCGEAIRLEDREAVSLAVSNLWSEGGPAQALYMHGACATEVLNRTGHFDPAILANSDCRATGTGSNAAGVCALLAI